jgi:hypothetical protein
MYFGQFFTQEKFVTLYPKHPVCISKIYMLFILSDILTLDFKKIAYT